MKNGCNNNIIPFYFISILFGVILAETENNIQQNIEMATFGAGCFWCVEAIFETLDGVLDVQSGYTGGNVKNPSYEDICTGTTGHAEVIQITYNANVISFDKLLNIFWMSHNPTTLNQQGADIGTQYRSVIFHHNKEQEQISQKSTQKVANSKMYVNPIVTEIIPLGIFYPAEDYHQNYYRVNPNAPYCQVVIKPKLEKFKKQIN